MVAERQTAWGWLITFGLFFTGAGAGVFLVSFLLEFLSGSEPAATWGALVGPLLVAFGACFFLADLGSRATFYLLISNARSWMSRGVWVILASIIFGLGYALPSFSPFTWLPWSKATTFGNIVGFLAAIFSFIVLVYGGLLLAKAKRIPFWNTPLLPILFLFSGLSCGIGLLNLVALFFVPASGQGIPASLHTIGVAEIVIILMELLILGVYVEITRSGNTSSVESVHLLKTPLFIGGALALGLVVPLGLLLYSALAGGALLFSTIVAIAAVLLLVGGILLRYSVIKAGVGLPLYSM